MRIMDWSSDVCSSDLAAGGCVHVVKDRRVRHPCTDRRRAVPLQVVMRAPARKIELGFDPGKLKAIRRPAAPAPRLTKDRLLDPKDLSSEARRVGKEGVRPGRSRWSPYH